MSDTTLPVAYADLEPIYKDDIDLAQSLTGRAGLVNSNELKRVTRVVESKQNLLNPESAKKSGAERQ